MNFIKKILFFALVLGFNTTLPRNSNLSNFDKGQNFRECLINCRKYHRDVLKLPKGYGQGACFNICESEYGINL